MERRMRHLSNSRTASSPQVDLTSMNGEQHPMALPSALTEKYRKRQAIGTVLVGENFPEGLNIGESLFEMVTPMADPELKDIIQERVHGASSAHVSSAFTSSLRGVEESPCRSRDLSPLTERQDSRDFLDRLVVPSGARTSRFNPHVKPRKILKEGGYVIFSDDYLKAHPYSPVTSITQEFQRMSPAVSMSTPPPALARSDGTDEESQKRKQALVQSYIKEAERETRPLFRRKRSDLVYGRAAYVTIENECSSEEEEGEEVVTGLKSVVMVGTSVYKTMPDDESHTTSSVHKQ